MKSKCCNVDKVQDTGRAQAAPNRDKLMLVAVDDGEPSRWAVEVAVKMAQEMSAKLMLLHVVAPASGAAGEFVATLECIDTERHQEGEAMLEKVGQGLPASLDCRHVVRDGNPADEIIAVAKGVGADMVVMGTRGRGRLAQFFLGSTAEAVIRQATFPVVTVGHQAAWATPMPTTKTKTECGQPAEMAATAVTK